VLSAADDEAVTAFLAGDLRLPDITNVVASVIELHEPMEVSLEAIREADFWARNMAKNSIATLRLRR
jgi:1-deoxy-D-xylulose 5-phosphate reductoisomerase